ncbi:hypothetical protein HYT04_00630, partial [Candidatus Kaiserbacteria bacterium]|nr:hypothetical protein [Candidatus Kaiserbacteria bacterium]
MGKDFCKWHAQKEHLHEAKGTALFHEREVWWCALGANIGFEQDGSGELFARPVVILSKFNLDVCLVVPRSESVSLTGRCIIRFAFSRRKVACGFTCTF